MAKSKQTYSEALTELKTIISELENNSEMDMESIFEKVKRASVLLENCKKRLHSLDVELEKVLETL